MAIRRLGVFWGCRILSGDLAFELSTRAVLRALGVEVVDLGGQMCCGEPIRSLSIPASCYLSMRVLASSASEGFQEILVPCSKGYYMMRWAPEILNRSPELRKRVEEALASEGFDIERLARPLALVDLLHDLLREGAFAEAGELGMSVAVHPGCYLLRAGGQGEGMERLRKLRDLLKAVGVEAPYYAGIMDCCGGSLDVSRMDSALALAGSKIKSASEAGLSCLVVLCPSCFEMLDGRQEEALAAIGGGEPLPVLYLSQILGLALGLGQDELGMKFNRSPLEKIKT